MPHGGSHGRFSTGNTGKLTTSGTRRRTRADLKRDVEERRRKRDERRGVSVSVRPTGTPKSANVDITGLRGGERQARVEDAFPQLSAEGRARTAEVESFRTQQAALEAEAGGAESAAAQEEFIGEVQGAQLADSPLQASLDEELAARTARTGGVFEQFGLGADPLSGIGVTGIPPTPEAAASEGARAVVGGGILAGVGGALALISGLKLGAAAATTGAVASTNGGLATALGAPVGGAAASGIGVAGTLAAASFVTGLKAIDVLNIVTGKADPSNIENIVGKFGESSSDVVAQVTNGGIEKAQGVAEINRMEDMVTTFHNKLDSTAALRPGIRTSQEYNTVIAEIEKIQRELRTAKFDILTSDPEFNEFEVRRLIAKMNEDESNNA